MLTTSFVILAFGAVGILGFDGSKQDNLAVYWGQNSYGAANSGDTANYQKNLSFYCQDDTIDAIPLAFVDTFFSTGNLPSMNLANTCSVKTGVLNGTQLPDCSFMASDIKTCQGAGKIVTISLGGATGGAVFTGDDQAKSFADSIWNLFLGGKSDTRPFGDAVLDGVDLDIEGGASTGFTAFVQQLRSHMDGADKKYYVTGAPQCPFPDAYLGTVIDAIGFDALYVQFYNNFCGVNNYNNSNAWDFGSWDDWAKKTSPNKDIKIYVGAPASKTAANSGYVDASTLAEIISESRTKYSSFGGVMLWDASQAYANNRFDKAVKGALTDGAGSSSTPSSGSASATVSGSSISGVPSSTPPGSSSLPTSSAASAPIPSSASAAPPESATSSAASEGTVSTIGTGVASPSSGGASTFSSTSSASSSTFYAVRAVSESIATSSSVVGSTAAPSLSTTSSLTSTAIASASSSTIVSSGGASSSEAVSSSVTPSSATASASASASSTSAISSGSTSIVPSSSASSSSVPSSSTGISTSVIGSSGSVSSVPSASPSAISGSSTGVESTSAIVSSGSLSSLPISSSSGIIQSSTVVVSTSVAASSSSATSFPISSASSATASSISSSPSSRIISSSTVSAPFSTISSGSTTAVSIEPSSSGVVTATSTARTSGTLTWAPSAAPSGSGKPHHPPPPPSSTLGWLPTAWPTAWPTEWWPFPAPSSSSSRGSHPSIVPLASALPSGVKMSRVFRLV